MGRRRIVPKDILRGGRFFYLHDTYSSLVDVTRAKIDLQDKGYYVRVRKFRSSSLNLWRPFYAIYKTRVRPIPRQGA